MFAICTRTTAGRHHEKARRLDCYHWQLCLSSPPSRPFLLDMALRLIPLALALCYCAKALATTPSLEDVQQLLDLSLEELIATPVVTASRQSETRDQTPAHVMVFTREQIRQRRYQNLADLLEDLPGVNFQRGTKSSQFNQFTVQGYLGPNKLVLMLDGIRIGQPSGGNIPVAENLALYHAKQVEVVFGPAAALYGADAVAGVVNIITDNATNATANGATGTASVGLGRFGSRDTSFFTSAKISERLGISVGGHSQRSDRAPLDEFYPDDFQKVDGQFNGRTVLPAATREAYTGGIRSSSVFARLDLGEPLTAGFYRHRFNSLTSTGDPYAMARYDRAAQWQTTNDTVYARYRHRLGENLHGKLTLDHAQMQVDPRAYYSNAYNDFGRSYSYVQGKRTGIEESLHWQVNERHQVQGGLGWQEYTAIEAASMPQPYNTDLSPTDQGMVYPNTPGFRFDTPHTRFHNLSAYVQWQAQWSEQLSSVAGVRLDRHSVYGSSINPRLGVVFAPSKNHVFKALYGQAFRAPSPEESLSTIGHFDGRQDADGRYIGTNFRVGNEHLEPETVRSLSLTWDWRPAQHLNFSTNLYHSRISHLVVNMPTADVITPTVWLQKPETKGNAGYQYQRGLDVSAQWRFRWGRNWTGDLWGSASWIHGRINTGNGIEWQIPYVASRQLKLGTTLRWRDQWSITPKLRWSSSTTNGRTKAPANPLLPAAHCSSTPSAPTRCSTPGAAVLDLHLGWHQLLDGKATLWLDVTNVLDKRYYAAGGGGSMTFWDMPQQPRRWMLTLDYRF